MLCLGLEIIYKNYSFAPAQWPHPKIFEYSLCASILGPFKTLYLCPLSDRKGPSLRFLVQNPILISVTEKALLFDFGSMHSRSPRRSPSLRFWFLLNPWKNMHLFKEAFIHRILYFIKPMEKRPNILNDINTRNFAFY